MLFLRCGLLNANSTKIKASLNFLILKKALILQELFNNWQKVKSVYSVSEFIIN